jgi:hypothetical protein
LKLKFVLQLYTKRICVVRFVNNETTENKVIESADLIRIEAVIIIILFLNEETKKAVCKRMIKIAPSFN